MVIHEYNEREVFVAITERPEMGRRARPGWILSLGCRPKELVSFAPGDKRPSFRSPTAPAAPGLKKATVRRSKRLAAWPEQRRSLAA